MSIYERVSISEDADKAYEVRAARQAFNQPESEPETGVKVTHTRDADRVFMDGSKDARPASDLEPFRDMQEATTAMFDKRYTDPDAHAFRADVQQRIWLMMRER